MSVELLLETRDGQDVALLSVDAVLEEQHSLKSRVTQYPIEDGGTISDHVYNEPEAVTLTGFITNTPVGSEPATLVRFDTSLQLATGLEGFQAFQPPAGYATAAEDGFQVLQRLRERRAPVTILSNLQRYENMVLTDLDIPRNAATGRAKDGQGGTLKFTASFQRVRFVATETTTVDLRSTSLPTGRVRDQAAPTVQAGRQATNPAGTSWLRQIQTGASQSAGDALDALGSLFKPQAGGAP